MPRALLMGVVAVCVAAGITVGIALHVNSGHEAPDPPAKADAVVAFDDGVPPVPEGSDMPFVPSKEVAKLIQKPATTPEEAREHRKRLWKFSVQQAMKRKDRRTYALGVSPIVRRMATAKDPAVRLTREQVGDVEKVTEEMRGEIEAALEDVWFERHELNNEMRTIHDTGRDQHMEPARQRYRELAEKEKVIREELNEEYCARLKSVLTEEQQPFLAGDLSEAQLKKLYGYSPKQQSRSYTVGTGNDRVQINVPVENPPPGDDTP